MLVTFIITFFAILFAYISGITSNNQQPYTKLSKVDWLFVSFLIIFLFQALRYDFGNDYIGYEERFYKIKAIDLDFNSLIKFSESHRTEIGYVFLCRFFPVNNFFIFIAIWSLINCFVYYNLIKNYVPPKYHWFALAIYLLIPTGMLIQLSALRQVIAIWFFVWAFKYFRSGDFIRYTIIILTGGLIHTSILFFIPLYFLQSKKILKDKLLYIFFTIFIGLFFVERSFQSLISPFIVKYFDRYAYTTRDYIELRSQTVTEIFIKIIIFSMIMFTYQHRNLFLRRVSILASFFIIFAMFISILPQLDRLTMYFIPFLIIILPYSLMSIKNIIIRNALTFLIIIYYIKQLYTMFYSDVWSEKYFIYKTIFSI
jgi:hypothetical protein